MLPVPNPPISLVNTGASRLMIEFTAADTESFNERNPLPILVVFTKDEGTTRSKLLDVGSVNFELEYLGP